MGRELDTVYEVGHDPPKRVVVAGGFSRFASTDEITVTPADGGVEVRYEAEFRLSGVMAVAEPFLRGRFRKVAEDAVAGLRRRLGA